MATILVIEDDPALQEVLHGLLDMEGYIVLLAGSGEAALVTLTNDDVDLALVDLRLPSMDGFALCDRIRASSKQPPAAINCSIISVKRLRPQAFWRPRYVNSSGSRRTVT